MGEKIIYPFLRGPRECNRLVRQGEFFAECTERFLRKAGIGAASRVLDFGCGTGAVSTLLRKLDRESMQIVGYEPHAETAACARSRTSEYGVQLVTRLPRGRFDAIVMRMVLMYVDKPVKLLKRLRRKLKPGGVLALQESDHRDYMHTEPESELFQSWRRRIMATGRWCGVRLDTASRLPSLLAAAGFVAIEPHGEQFRVDRGADSPVHDVLADTAIGMAQAMQAFQLAPVPAELTGPVPPDLASLLRDEAAKRALQVHSSRLIGITARRPGATRQEANRLRSGPGVRWPDVAEPRS